VIHLDTSFLIQAIAGVAACERPVRRWLEQGEELAMSAVAWAEFLCGPLGPTEHQLAIRFITLRVPLTEQHAALAARLYNDTGRRRGSLVDCMIAATAIRSGASLATANAADFRRFLEGGLRLVGERGSS